MKSHTLLDQWISDSDRGSDESHCPGRIPTPTQRSSPVYKEPSVPIRTFLLQLPLPSWLRSSVVSVLFSLTTESSLRRYMCVISFFDKSLSSLWTCPCRWHCITRLPLLLVDANPLFHHRPQLASLWRKIESLPSANSRHGILQTILALLPHRHDWMLIKQSRYFFPERSPVIQKEQVHPTPPFDRSPHHAEITRQEKGTSTIFAYTSPAFHIGPKAQCKNLAVSFRAAAETAQDLKCHISR